MKPTNKELATILLFALLHSVMTVISRWQDLSDQLMLTTLTMLMAVSLCQIRKTSVNTMIVVLVIVNIGGLFLGRFIGKVILYPFLHNIYIRGALTTFLTTVFIGFAVLYFLSILRKIQICRDGGGKEISIYWLMLTFTVIIVARLLLIQLSNDYIYKSNITLNVLIDYTFCCIAMLYLAVNSIRETRKAQEAKEKSDISHYSYLRLQQQVKPHFMFNNLNILNTLICEGMVKEASDFVYKLAYLYRYMIENEDENLVTVREEMDFVSKFTELMKVRFDSSFSMEYEMDEEIMSAFVVPCSIQLLVENAIKHNGGTAQTPLNIRVYNTDDNVVVWNNRIPKNSCEPTTHLGLKYIKQLFKDISKKDVVIESDDDEFIVKLPLIR